MMDERIPVDPDERREFWSVRMLVGWYTLFIAAILIGLYLGGVIP